VLDPYKNQTPVELLSREYLLATANIGIGTQNKHNAFSLLLAKMPPSVLSLYRYFRYDGIELRIVITADPQTFGIVALSWHPYGSPDPLQLGGNLQQLSQMNMQYMHLSESTEMIYQVPYYHTQDWLQRVDGGSFPDHTLSTVVLWTIGYLGEVAGGSVSVPYQVYARFVNPRLAGFVAQSDHPFARAMDGLGQAATRHRMGAKMRGLSAMAGAASMLWSVTSAAGALGDVQSTPQVTAGDSTTETEMSQKPTAVKQELYGPWNTINFVPDSPYLSTKTQKYAPKSAMFGAQLADVSVNDLIRIPSLTRAEVFSSSADSFGVAARLDLDLGGLMNSTYCAYLSQMYLWWRGGIKVKIVFTGSPLVTSRIAILLTWDTSIDVTTPVNNCPSRIVTVRGPTEVEFEIPYLYPYPWMPTCDINYNLTASNTLGDLRNTYQYPTLALKFLGQQSPGGSFVPVPYLIFTAAAEDFCFRDLCFNMPDYVPAVAKQRGPTMEAQGILDDFDKPFEMIGAPDAPVTMREPGDNHTVRQILQHWSRRDPGVLTTDPLFTSNDSTRAQMLKNGMFDFLLCLFVFTDCL